MSESLEQGVDQEVIDADLPEEEGDEEEITIGQPEAPTGEDETDETPVIRKMRAELKEKARIEREVKRELEQLRSAQVAKQAAEIEPQILPEKTLSDFDYDESAFVDHYNKRAESIVSNRAYAAKQAQKHEEAQAAYQTQFNAYTAQKDALKVPKERMKEAEESVMSVLDTERQNMILQTGTPARMVYAIGNSPEQLAKLAACKTRDEFNRELGRIEATLVTTRRKAVAPDPEVRIAAGSNSASRNAAKLEELANDPSKFSEYRALKKRMETKQ